MCGTVHTVASERDHEMGRGTIINLTVHGVGPASRSLDPGEDRTWVSVAQFEAAIDAVAERPDVRITFDDGNRSDVDIALPRLLDRGVRAEFFVLAGRLGESGRLDRSDLRELVGAGMEVSSHGWAHRDWRRLNEEAAREEIDEASSVLSRIVGRTVRRVAIPFGSYDRRVLGRLRRSGMERVFTSDGGRARTAAWLQNRTSLHHDLDTVALGRMLDPNPPLRTSARRATATVIKRTRGAPSCRA